MDRRVARTKKRIYMAFFELVQKKPISEITVTELAKAADIDRKTFYIHYQTVQDVYDEFRKTVYIQVMDILNESERRGKENQARLEAGEEISKAQQIAPFDFVYFYDSLNAIMLENMAFFEKLSKDTTFMFMKNDFKNILKEALLDKYPEWPGTSPYELNLYAEFIASGAIGMWCTWLSHKQPVTIEEFKEGAIRVLADAWELGC